MTSDQINAKYAAVGKAYHDGLSLPAIIRAVGTDDESLRIIRSQIGVAMSTLRREVAEMTAKDEYGIKLGDVLTLPFWGGGEPGSEDYEYEVEKIDGHTSDRVPVVTLIMLRDGQREKTKRGHFYRLRRAADEIRADLDRRSA